MCRLANNDQRIIAITAAMAEGTGLLKFQQRFPTRFFDVGIAEEHAVVFASGLAKSGLRPVIAMYGTFLQRALDCVYHDICLQNLPVIICVDRAGAVEDGASHHGIWDLGFARQLPNLSILFPADWSELDMMLTEAIKISAPVMIRYPRGSAESTTSAKHPIIWGKAIDEQYDENATISIWGCGREVMTAIKTSALLKEKYGLLANVVNPRFIRPFDITRIMQDVKAKRHIVSIEDNCLSGGMASVIDEILINTDHLPIQHFGWKSGTILPFGNLQDIRNQQGLTAEKIAEAIAEKCMQ